MGSMQSDQDKAKAHRDHFHVEAQPEIKNPSLAESLRAQGHEQMAQRVEEHYRSRSKIEAKRRKKNKAQRAARRRSR